MKPILSFLLLLLLSGCNYRPSAKAAGAIGDKVKACCSTISMAKEPQNLVPACSNRESDAVSVFSATLLERSGQILTW